VVGLVDRLRAFYGALPVPPPLPFAVYVWEVLSVGTTPVRRDAAFAALKKIPALTSDAIGRVPQAKLEAAVALAGPMKDERIRALRAGSDVFRRNPSLAADLTGPAGRALRAVRRVPHLGRASSMRLLLFSGAASVLPLDEHALRVALRLGYAPGPADRPPARVLSLVRQALMRESGRESATLRLLSQYFTYHGLSTCTETAPHCSVCPLAHDCEWIRRQ
jgi:endonuclease III